MYSVNDITETIQNWFSKAHNCKEVCDTYIEILKVTERQYELEMKKLIMGE